MTDEEFMKVCSFGSESDIIQAIEDGANVNAHYPGGTTALMIAVNRNYSEAVKKLIKNGADVNAKTTSGSAIEGNTALLMAVGANHKDIVSILLRHNADVNARTKGGSTALMRAEDSETAERLIMNGADVNARTEEGDIALVIARRWGRRDVMKTLLKYGADVVPGYTVPGAVINLAAKFFMI